jgi:hypothetical protein
MTLKIEQSAHPHPQRSGYWTWSVWLGGVEQELDKVSSVRYQLHSTFRNPTRESADRSSKFAIKSAGWGEFTIYAVVKFVDGRELPMQHWLRLEENPSASSEPVKVFLSYDFSDSHIAQPIGAALTDLGVHVSDPNTVRTGSSLASSLTKLIEEADLAIMLIGKSFGASNWTELEIRELQHRGIQILPVIMDSTVPSAVVEERNLGSPIRINKADGPAACARAINQAIPGLIGS